jgi:hypothetical protein
MFPLRSSTLATFVLLVAGCAAAQDIVSSDGLTGTAWEDRRAAADQSILSYIDENPASHDAFLSEPLGSSGSEGMPFVVFRVLPDLVRALAAPGPLQTEMGDLTTTVREGWLADVGLFGNPGQPFPLALTWTRPPVDAPEPSLLTRTCAGCHTGRVRLADGSIKLLLGAPSTEARIHDFNARVSATVAKLATHFVLVSESPATWAPKPELKELVVRLLRARQSDSPTWFFRGVAGYDAAREAAEIEKVIASLDVVLPVMKAINERSAASRQKVVEGPYATAHAPSFLTGPGGSFDTTATALAPVVASEHLPEAPTRVDFPAVWNQNTRTLGEWDGRMRSAYMRNLSAGLANVGDPSKVDLGAAARVTAFVGGLPSTPYPFRVDAELEARGRILYADNCAGCHTADQRTLAGEPRVWGQSWGPDAVPTDMNRANGVNETGFLTFTGVLKATARCSAPGGAPAETSELCASPDRWLVHRTSEETRGYIASPLDGIWARAPYLHNGSVPTLRHLLSGKRPASFLRGSISYDTHDVGFAWEPSREAELRARGDTVTTLDTTLSGYGNVGHTGTVTLDGKVLRMTWKDGSPELEALLEYMKTL